MISEILSVMASPALGSIVGLIGSQFTKMEDRKLKAAEFEFKLKMAKIEAEESAAEAAHGVTLVEKQIELAQAEGDIQKELAASKSFLTSIKEGAKSTGSGLVDSIRGAMRPIITLYLLVMSTALMIQLSYTVGINDIPLDKLIDLYSSVLDKLLFLTVTSVTWWFGSRPQKTK